jgi:hypothetical protein
MFGGSLGKSCYITAVSGLQLVHKGRGSTTLKLVLVYLLYSCVENHVGYLIGYNTLLKMHECTSSISMHDTKQVEKYLNLTIRIAIRSKVTVESL